MGVAATAVETGEAAAVSNENVYETSARFLKAQKFVAHLSARDHTSESVSKMHPHVLAHHAMMAGIQAPSDDTMEVVHSMLQANENAKKNQPRDPFAGLS